MGLRIVSKTKLTWLVLVFGPSLDRETMLWDDQSCPASLEQRCVWGRAYIVQRDL